MMKVSVYLFEGEGVESIPAQQEAAREYCRKSQYESIFFEESSSEDACRGRSFEFALKTATLKLSDGLLVYSLDSLEAKGISVHETRELLRQHGKKLLSIQAASGNFQGCIKPSPKPRHTVLLEQQQQHKPFKGTPPFGYDLVSGLLSINIVEQAIKADMARRKAAGETLAEIAHGLNCRGIRTKLNRSWSSVNVFNTLRGHL